MKLYPSKLNVNLSYQNCGSKWLVILSGETEKDIEMAFNGLFNFCATNGKLTFTNHLKTLAYFWSSEEKMRRYFRLHCEMFLDRYRAHTYAQEKIKELESSSQTFFNYDKQEFVDTYDVGTSRAERPDADFRDKVLTYALKDKSDVKQVEKELALV
jgi:hypothetical protein